MTTLASGRARTAALLLVGCMVALTALAGLPTKGPVALASPPQQGTTTVAVTPATASIQCGAEVELDVRINDVEKLFGVDIKLSFDPAVLEAIDANATTPGTQIEPGDLPDVSGGQGLIQVNMVDANGTVSYAAVRLNPAPSQSGSGTIASFKVKGKANGTSPITVVSAILADETARAISAELVNGQVTVAGCSGVPGPTATQPTGSPTTPAPTAVPPPGGGPKPGTHVVKPGETLFGIARLYGTSVSAIMAANKIYNPDLIYAGQVLVLPGHAGGPPPSHPPYTPPYTPGKPGYPPDKNCHTHIVKPGESLFGIALMSGESVDSLARRNGILNPHLIYAGQALTVCPLGGPYHPPVYQPKPGYPHDPYKPGGYPGSGKCRFTHVVQPGDNLFRIALGYGFDQTTLAVVNNLANPHLIYVGQVLCIP